MTTQYFMNENIEERQIHELIGMCRGMLADGEVNIDEARFLLNWLKRNKHGLNTYPFNVLYNRLTEILSDGVIDNDEQLDLIDLFMSIVGEPVIRDENNPAKGHRGSAPAMPYTRDKIDSIKDKVFTLTGEFDFGGRAEIVKLIEGKGGLYKNGVSKKTQYLIIGNIGSDMWQYSSFGRKIEKALAFKDQGVDINVMGEIHLMPHLT